MGLSRRPRRLLAAPLLLVLLLLVGAAAGEQSECRVINAEGTDATLQFPQYTPREEVSRKLLKRATAEVRRVLKDVQSISFDIRGEDIREKVGQHHVNARIAPSGACFTLHYTITPVDECTAPEGAAYRHRCHPSTQCFDTEQSYECVCPEGYEAEGRGRCGGKTSTAECCAGVEQCKRAFMCVPSLAGKGAQDRCRGQCVKEASCVQVSRERDLFECRCPDELFGNGKHCFGGAAPPPAVFDRHGQLQGKILAEDYCGCRVRTVDFCIGVDCGDNAVCVSAKEGHKCECEPGYSRVGENCVDTQGLQILLVGDKHVKLVQGDEFDDKLVSIRDENGMTHEARQISISMSDPVLNEDTLDQVGSYEIRYSVTAPWTNTPTITETRTIEVVDLDECALKPGDPKWEKWRPMCHPWADCINTVGGYKCVCRAGTLGGGAAANRSVIAAEGHRVPDNADDGPPGCRDVQPPSLFVSDWEKTFKVCKCEGLGGPDTPQPSACHARNYGAELSDLLFKERRLCTGDWPCFEAFDDTADGRRVNLTNRVQALQDRLREVGENEEAGEAAPQEEGQTQGRRMGRRVGRGGGVVAASIRRFELPLEVEDDAHNVASAVLRFRVEEISLWDVIQPDKPPARSPTMPKVPPPPPAPVPAPAREREDSAAVTRRGLAAGDAENETRECESSTTTTTRTTTTTTTATTTSEGDGAAFDEEHGLLQLLFMLLVGGLVLLCIWGTRGTTPPEAVTLDGDGASDPLDASATTSVVYTESSPNPLRHRAGSAPPTPATPLRSPAVAGSAPFFSPHLT